MDIEDFKSLVLYYGRSRFYHCMQKNALDGLAKYPMESSFRIFNGIALALGNHVQEGIRELNPLKNDPELGICAILALIYAHTRCSIVDREALQALQQMLNEENRISNANAAYYAALFYYLTNNIDKTREFTDKALKYDGKHQATLLLKGWNEMKTSSFNRNVLHLFEKILTLGKNIDASLGLVRYYHLCGEFDEAISTLNKLSIRYPELNIPLIEKMETQLAALNWEQAFETALRIINLEPTNIIALRVKALYLIIRENNFKAGVATIQQLITAVEHIEVGNFDLAMDICQLFSRSCSRNSDVLSVTIKLMEKVCKLNPENVIFLTELGFQLLINGNIQGAVNCFRIATKMNGNYVLALYGLTYCQLIENGANDQTRQQIELLDEFHDETKTSDILFLKAKLTKQTEEAIRYLIKATEIHLRIFENITFGIDYIRLLNIDYLLQIIAELLRHSPIQLKIKSGINILTDNPHITLKQCSSILESIIHSCPGHAQAIYMKGKVEFMCGEFSNATATLQRLLTDSDATYASAAHLMLAQIQVHQEQYGKAMQSLEMTLSHNFAVRDYPKYHLLMGIIQKQQHHLNEAQKSFLTAMQLIGCSFIGIETTKETINQSTQNDCALGGFTMADKMTLYLELICTYKEIGDAQAIYDSERLLQCAMDEFSNTPEEGRLVIAHADLMIQNCNVAKAINLLSAIQPGQSYFIQAKTHLANLYLQHRKDRISFAKCFKELVETCPEAESYLMLGEAYMSIQEPDLAVEAYQMAMNLNPYDPQLASKLGRAYVKTHQYNKAINYYQEALKNPDYAGLKLDLAELFLKLKQYQNATETLINCIELKNIDTQDISVLQMQTKQLLLLARVYEKSGKIEESLKTLKLARENHQRVQKRNSVEQPGNLNEQNKILSKICILMAQQFIHIRENDQALKSFKDCLKYTPNDIEVLSSLARLYMQMNSMDSCRDICSQILQLDTNNEVASVMMADLSFRKMEFENAAFHFSQLLLSQPCYWTALARLIEVMRRSGTLNEVNSFIQRAEQTIENNSICPPGLNYCKGLYEWYKGNPNGALRNFNSARRDREWGQQAIFNMINICINPDGDIPNSNDMQETNDNGEFNESRMIALRTAERLLKELRPNVGGISNEILNHRLLHNFLQLASKNKFQIESALQEFTNLATSNEYQNMVGPAYGMAFAYILLKQTQRAKNQLKRIARTSWNFEEAEYMERSWLLLADIYIHANKLDVAESFVERVLEHNKSSTKAYELAGYIAEKSQLYRDAAKHYYHAWNCGGRTKPQIGYKLAFNYMKIKRYAYAIDVCQQVIKLHPDYTVIRKEIMDKCRSNLRP